MTVETTVRKVTGNGNGSATSFSFSPMVIYTSSDLVVTKRNTAGVETLLTEGSGASNYTVVVAAYPGTGSITYPSTGSTRLQTGEKLIITPRVPLTQTVDLENQGGYFPEVQETEFDRLVHVDQQQQEQIDRSLKLTVGHQLSSAEVQGVPAAGQVLAANAGATGFLWSSSLPSSAAVSAFALTFLDDNNAGAVLTTLGVSAFVQTLLDDANAAAFMTTLGMTSFGQSWVALANRDAAWNTLASGITGVISGLTLSNNAGDANHDIDIAAGVAFDSTGIYPMKLASAMGKQLDAAWAAGGTPGTTVGGLFSGSIAANTWYHMFLIRKDADGTIDAGFDTSFTAANKPGGYSTVCRIGSVRTDGSSNIRPFFQVYDHFFWKAQIGDISVSGLTSSSTWSASTAISVPTGLKVIALLNGKIGANAVNQNGMLHVRSPDQTSTAATLDTQGAIGFTGAEASSTGRSHGQAQVLTNTSAQIQYSFHGFSGSPSVPIMIDTLGWIDPRGRS